MNPSPIGHLRSRLDIVMSDARPSLEHVPLILVVDDESTIRNGLSAFLEDSGYRVHRAQNGSEAMQFVRTAVPELIVTDYMMPEMSGDELAKRVRAIAAMARIPIILITGAGLPIENMTPGLFTDIVAKPFSGAMLVSHIDMLLSHMGREASHQ